MESQIFSCYFVVLLLPAVVLKHINGFPMQTRSTLKNHLLFGKYHLRLPEPSQSSSLSAMKYDT